jgi:hypothetical protein
MGLQVQGQNTKTGAPGQPFPQDQQNAPLVTELNARYYQNVYNGQSYCWQTLAAAAPTGAVPLGAAGTPIIALWNPPGSGYNAVVIQTSVAVRNVGTTLGLGSFWFSGGPTATITAAASVPLNMLTLTQAGSKMKAFSATALTGSSALLSMRPISGTGYNASVATTVAMGPSIEDTAGGIIVIPGNLIAITCSVTGGTGSTVDAGLVWVELPI